MALRLGGALGMVVSAAASKASVTPIQKVLTMMEEMKEKGIAEKDAEAVKYSAFETWCSGQTRVKKNEITKASETMEQLDAAIQKNAATIRKQTDRIQELEEDVGRWTKDQASVTEVRGKEKVDFQATVADYTESLDALDGAIATLKKQAFTRDQADAAMLQVKKQRLVPVAAKHALAAFLQQAGPDEMLFREAPEASGYEFQSGGVVDMLEKLKDEFATKKSELVVEETTAQHGFDQIMQQLTDNIENAKHEANQKTESRAQEQESKAQNEGDLVSTTADRKEDQTYLDDSTALCTQKANDFAARQELRAGEIEAISKAIEIIGSNAVSGAGDKNLPAMFLQTKGTSLAFLGGHQQSPQQQQAAAFLAAQARSSGSRVLEEIAAHVASDPFTKVKKLIKDLISKLMEEGTSETEHKGFCDAELAKNKQTRESRTSDINNLNVDIESTTATIAQLTQDVADLAAAVTELDAAVAEQTKDRASSKAANEQTVKEAGEAQTAVEQAMAVLKEFYAKAADATAFAQAQQAPADDAPETFDKPYTGMGASGGNIVDFLEVILTDFSRLESSTSAAEAAEQDEYEKFMFESKKDKAMKENESKHKSNTITDKESALHASKDELASSQDQLDKANAYYEKLKPTCVDSGITYEDRVKQREAEIQSLSEALKILAGQDLPTMG